MASNILPPPVAPTPPDFNFCSPFYGTPLYLHDCVEAASRLPVVDRFINVGGLPIVESPGPDSCRVTVDWAAPDTYRAGSGGEIEVEPDALRQTASRIISRCVSRKSWGGFSTLGLQNMINWIANDTTPSTRITNADWPVVAAFLTVTIDRPGNAAYHAAYDDPVVARRLRDGVRGKGNVERAHFLDLAATDMERSHNPMASAAWWAYIEDQGDMSPENRESEMVYTCDAALGAPNAADCAQLAYSELGPPSDTVTVGPGAAKLLSLKTCHAAITAIHPITLTWAQISAGLSTLLDTCVTLPWLASRGGRAFHSTSGTSKRRKRATATVTGLDALPPGVNITVSA